MRIRFPGKHLLYHGNKNHEHNRKSIHGSSVPPHTPLPVRSQLLPLHDPQHRLSRARCISIPSLTHPHPLSVLRQHSSSIPHHHPTQPVKSQLRTSLLPRRILESFPTSRWCGNQPSSNPGITIRVIFHHPSAVHVSARLAPAQQSLSTTRSACTQHNARDAEH